MNEFYQQYFCPYDEKYSVIIEDNGKVSYAYLLKLKNIIGDVGIHSACFEQKPSLQTYNSPQCFNIDWMFR